MSRVYWDFIPDSDEYILFLFDEKAAINTQWTSIGYSEAPSGGSGGD